MIIWGHKTKIQQVGQGSFFCPKCLSDATYTKQKASRYFTLYFIPLFSMKDLGEYICCDYCKAELGETVLQYSREQILEALNPWACSKCGAQNATDRTECLSCGTSRFAPPALP